MKAAPWLYKLSWFLLLVMLRVWNRFRVYGAVFVPARGGCILAANHASFLDPPVVGCGVSHRFMHFVARQDLLNSRFFKVWADRVGAIYLDRNKGDVAAMKEILKELKAGEAVALFPEGTRTRDGRLQKAKGGLGFLIAKAAVPVVPVYIDGTFKALPRHGHGLKRVPITVRYGQPITPAEIAEWGKGRENYEAIADLVMARIAQLKTEQEQSIQSSS